MNLLPSFFDFIKDLLTSSRNIDKFLGVVIVVVALIITLVILWMVYFIIMWMARKINWYQNRQHCVHCNQWTLGISEGKFPAECRSGQPCCRSCAHSHEMKYEDKYKCPVCGTVMDKRSVDDVHIVDVCPKDGCGHILRSPAEDAYVQQANYDRGYSDGQSVGTATGVAAGVAIGTAIN